MATGGINSVKGMFTLVGLLQSVVLIMCAVVSLSIVKSATTLTIGGLVEVPVDVEE